MLNLIILPAFPVLMAFAAASDLLTMRISNRLVLLLVALFLVVALIMNLPLQNMGVHFLCGFATLVVAFSFFAFGWMGGGDAKLAAAIALWLGWPLTLPFLVYSALFGGALTLAILAIRQWPLPAMLMNVSWITRLHHRQTGIPYGIALAAAGLVAYSGSEAFQFFAI